MRIALNLKRLDYESIFIHLRKEGGQHRKPEFLAKNPQGLLPVWEESGWTLNQSLAIIEYLDETHPEIPLMPKAPRDKAEVRALSQMIACEMHPLNNLRVLAYLRHELGCDQEALNAWYRHWVELGFDALETQLQQTAGEYCFGDSPGLVDCCLVPQVYNARRFDADLAAYPIIERIDRRLNELDACIQAAPENQPDAE